MKSTHDKKQVQDAIYSEAYQAWVASLSADERTNLTALNLAEPDTRRKTSKFDDELAMNLASCDEGTWGAGPQRGERSEGAEHASGDVAVALAAFCARVRGHANPLLAFDTLCFATGLMGLEGRTQRALAELHGVTNAAFSKQVVGWLDIFDLTPPRGCRSLRTRDDLSKARLLLRQKRSVKTAPERKGRQRKRYPDRSADPTVVFVRGLDLFRRWFHARCRKLPLRRWSPESRSILRTELAWFARLHAELSTTVTTRSE
jgi:hypothetical protein